MRSLNDHIRFYLLLILIPTLLLISAIDYHEANENIKTNFEKQKINSKESIEDSIELIDHRNKMLSDVFSKQMKQNSQHFLKEYNESEPDIYDIQLNSVKNRMNWSMELNNVDLYIINSTGVIVNTTYKTDMGLDFKNFPNFYSRLQNIFESGEFTSDLITAEIQTGKYRFFSYMPTPDSEYILEIGVYSEKLNYLLGQQSYHETVQRLKEINPYLKDLRIFHYNGVLVSDPTYNTTRQVNDICLEVYNNKTNKTLKGNGVKREYILVHLPHEDYPSDSSKVVEFTYNQNLKNQELRQNALLHIIMGAFSVIIVTITVFYISKYITRPINDMIDDIDDITKGHHDGNIKLEKDTKIEELDVLKNSTNKMLNKLRESINELNISKKREKFLKSLLRQDTNNNLFVSIGYLQLIDKNKLSDEDQKYLENAIKSNKKVLDLVELEREVKRATRDEYLREVSLQSVFRKVVKEVRNIDDENLEVYTEIEDNIGNVKGGHSLDRIIGTLVKTCTRKGECSRIRLSGKKVGEKIRVSIEDDGNTISDKIKTKISKGQYTGGSSGVGGAVYFIVKEIIEIYGGKLKIKDSDMGGVRIDIYLSEI